MSKPIISIIVIIFSLGFAFFYVKPEYDVMQSHRTDLDTLNKIFSKADNIKSLLSQTQQTLDGVDAADLRSFAVFLPETADPIRLAENIQHIGLKRGLVLQGIKVEGPANGTQKSAGGEVAATVRGAVGTFTIGSKNILSQVSETTDASASGVSKKYITTKTSFELTATMQAFKLFLNDLEKSLRLINVTALSLSPIQESDEMKKIRAAGPPLYKFEVTVETYSLK